ncbi:ABC transporter ATP-binding protein [Fusobacterium sp.]|uniref:ABC transporter ATP-binding protein n=1 Tax=Fusobacterium sp. TaxID=68766 RepID=UPI0029030CEA|nr:ABC transporter ATP-binding protein [Fusobacterium sp.]MDU1912382.1 ABC transporter ATP-binding protein [Fusobacterium sp.]
MSSIMFKNVCKDYGSTQVVKNLNLEINPGERLVLLGPSGCGKSTTLRMIAGLEKITSGELYFGDKLMNDIEAGERNVAMVFQNYALYPHMTVWDNITFGLRMNKVEREEIEKRAREALKILNLEGLEKRYSKELSGGQRQRVALCRAVVKQSPFFLLDEPLSNLDVQLRNTSREKLVKLHNLYRPTFVYVTHDQIEAMTIGHRIAVLNKGYLQQIDTPEKIYNNPVNVFVAKFIGIPQINILRANINEGDILFKNNTIKLSDEKRELIEKRREVYLGIRPEYVKVSRDKSENSIKGNIAKIENYGSQKCLLITVNGEEKVMASVPNDSDFKRYEDVYIKFTKKNMLFFDIATENNIEME